MAGVYENPEHIDPIGPTDIVTAGLRRFSDTITSSVDSYAKYIDKEQKESNKIINKTMESEQATMDKQYLKAKGQLSDFIVDPTVQDAETGEMTEAVSAPVIRDQVNDIIVSIATELNDNIKTAQNEGEGEGAINGLLDDAITEMRSFSDDMITWEVGRKQYMTAWGKSPNEVGAFLTNQSYPQMVQMYDAAINTDKGNLWITRDPNSKNTRVSLGKMRRDEFDVRSTMNLTLWSTETADKGQLFDEVTDDEIDYNTLISTVKEDARFKSEETGLDEEAIRDYFTNTDMGITMMNDYLMFPIQVRGQWRKLASASEVQRLNNTNTWNAYDDSFTDEAFIDKILDGTIDRLYQEGSMYTPEEKVKAEEEEVAEVETDVAETNLG